MPSDPKWYYSRDAEGHFVPSIATAGPWSRKIQHGGPPSALLASALEAEAKKLEMPFVSRVTLLFYRPVKVAAVLKVDVERLRVGNKVAHVQGVLVQVATRDADGTTKKLPKPVTLMTATGLCTRALPVKVPPPPATLSLKPPPPPSSVKRFAPMTMVPYGRSFDYRLVTATEGKLGKGPTESWARMLVRLVEQDDQPMSPLVRTMSFCDSAGGVSNYIPMHLYSFVNADLTLNLLRPMQGEWCCMRARTDLCGEAGQGLASAELWDETGLFGRLSQQQVLESKM